LDLVSVTGGKETESEEPPRLTCQLLRRRITIEVTAIRHALTPAPISGTVDRGTFILLERSQEPQQRLRRPAPHADDKGCHAAHPLSVGDQEPGGLGHRGEVPVPRTPNTLRGRAWPPFDITGLVFFDGPTLAPPDDFRRFTRMAHLFLGNNRSPDGPAEPHAKPRPRGAPSRAGDGKAKTH